MPLTPEQREFVKRVWEHKKPWRVMTYLELEKLYEWFLERCRELDIDPYSIDFEMIVDSTLDYYENQARLEQEFIGLIPTPPELEELEYYRKRVEELEKEIEKLRKTIPEEEIERLRNEIKKWRKKYEEAKRIIEKTKRTEGLTEEDVARITQRVVKETLKPLREVFKTILRRVRTLEERISKIPTKIEIPAEVIERLAAPTLPEIKIKPARCPKCGKEEPQFVEETLFTVMKLFAFPADYWYMCDECRSKYLGFLPPEKYMLDAVKPSTLQMTIIPPQFVKWVMRAAMLLANAKLKKR